MKSEDIKIGEYYYGSNGFGDEGFIICVNRTNQHGVNGDFMYVEGKFAYQYFKNDAVRIIALFSQLDREATDREKKSFLLKSIV